MTSSPPLVTFPVGSGKHHRITGSILTDNGGMLDNILWNTFASSDGESGTGAVFNDDTYGPDTDTAPFFFEVNDVWQYQSAPADAGIVWTILSDNFYSSDGTAGSIGLDTSLLNAADRDASLYKWINNLLQAFATNKD